MAVDTSNLAVQVQDRIDNLSGSETLDQLLVLRKAADNLGLSLVAIESAITAKLNSFDAATVDEDLLIGNRAASLSSGVSSSGGVFVPSFISGALTVSPGEPAGGIISIDPDALGYPGERVMLYKLSVNTSNQPGITVSGSIQGDIISGVLDDTAGTSGSFNIGTFRDTSSNGTVPSIFLETDEVLTVTAAAETVETIFYQYAIGQVK